MGEASSNSDPTPPPDSGGSEATRADVGREPPTQPRPIVQAQPPYQPTYIPPVTPAPPPQTATYAPPPEPVSYAPRPEPVSYAPTAASVPPPPPVAAPSKPQESEVVRYGPGVPVSQAGLPASQPEAAAESVWRSGRRPEPPPRRRRLRRLLGLPLTVILLVAAGAVLYLRFFDHPALHVTGVRITQLTKTGCTVDVTGWIDTNGAAGTVSYQWVYRPQTQAPQPLDQSVVAGSHGVFVTDAVEGQGHHGTASLLVTLDVLGPGTGTASNLVTISC